MPEFKFNSTLAELHRSVESGCFLGFDFGLKRIGVASGNTITCTATSVSTVSNKGGIPDWGAIDEIIEEWQPVGLVVGRPVHMDGSTQEMTNHAKGFARQLFRRYTLSVYGTDERQTSREAEALLKHNRQLGLERKTQRQDIDKIAASLLLSQWLESAASCGVK